MSMAHTLTHTRTNTNNGGKGYMVGSLIIMTCITIANMRKGVLLHKLILVEVGVHQLEVLVHASMADAVVVDFWLLAGLLHSIPVSNLCLVAECRRHSSQHFLVVAQCHRMAEAQTFLVQDREPALHR